ncbi:hypothetical protein [Luteimonas huabeiensis]|uniref:hypothetical protein n=1 Tax=Luteimonas huabeiensis TaxID=1244513 RepID=UPI0004633689|nr:hypothetical protein [Luteimonas huabeiensis]
MKPPEPEPAPARAAALAALIAACLAGAAPAQAPVPAAPAGAPSAEDIAPLGADEWNRFAQAIDTLRLCVEGTRGARTPAQSVQALQALGLAGEMRERALALLPPGDPGRAAIEAAPDDAQAIMRSFQAVSAWAPSRPIDQARALAYVYHFEARATGGACVPSEDFLSNYQKTLS